MTSQKQLCAWFDLVKYIGIERVHPAYLSSYMYLKLSEAKLLHKSFHKPVFHEISTPIFPSSSSSFTVQCHYLVLMFSKKKQTIATEC